nr:MAG TPA: hypothetical protein [Bacteriophage sp.]DAU18043.1 MAG TPA: hypothetical protein [Bacteriophage sp.]
MVYALYCTFGSLTFLKPLFYIALSSLSTYFGKVFSLRTFTLF